MLTVDFENFQLIEVWFNTQEVEASVKLNNIKYKILKQELINTYYILDLIWMLYSHLIVSKHLLDIFRKCLIMWAGKYVANEDNKDKVIGGLNLSAMEANDLSEAIKSARIEGALLRSQQQGHKEGFQEAEHKFVLKLLESFSPEDISRDYDISLERVMAIKNGN